MPMRVHASAPDLKRLARDLKEVGAKDLRKELYSGLNRSTKPMRGEIKEKAKAILPSGGGLNERVAAANIRVNGSGGKVRIIARPSKRGGQFDPKATDSGEVEHPTYGHKPTVKQAVTPGWFTEPVVEGLPKVENELLAGIEVCAAKLAGRPATIAAARQKIRGGDAASLTAEERTAFDNASGDYASGRK